MLDNMKFHKGQRYLKIKGYVFPWTKPLSKRKDAREFFPDFGENGENETVPVDVSEDDGLVTRDFLETRTKPELEDYAKKVYGIDLDKREKKESLVEQILELQKRSGTEE